MITMTSVTVDDKLYFLVAHEPELSDWRHIHDMTVHITTPVPMDDNLAERINKISEAVRNRMSPDHTRFIEVLFSF